jgi:HD-GYP domain-containing protein (c-di-GMP phosphodiesterase class II)
MIFILLHRYKKNMRTFIGMFLFVLFPLFIFLMSSCTTQKVTEIEESVIKQKEEEDLTVQLFEDTQKEIIEYLEEMELLTAYFLEALRAKGEDELNQAVNIMERNILAIRNLKVPEGLDGFHALNIEKGQLVQKFLRASFREDEETIKVTQEQISEIANEIGLELSEIKKEHGID